MAWSECTRCPFVIHVFPVILVALEFVSTLNFLIKLGINRELSILRSCIPSGPFDPLFGVVISHQYLDILGGTPVRLILACLSPDCVENIAPVRFGNAFETIVQYGYDATS